MKKLMWAILFIATIIYAVVITCWIQEGNRHFDQQRAEHAKGL